MPIGGVPLIQGIYKDYVCVRDKKAQGTSGGTFTEGDWRTRDLNEELADTAGIAAIASNQITLAAGTYRISASAPAEMVASHQLRLYSVTDDSVLLVGSAAYANPSHSDHVHALLSGRFTLAAQKVLEIQHRCQTTHVINGLGAACGYTDEIYTVAEFWREAS